MENKVTFWFFRHGYSCFNLYKDKTKIGMVFKYLSNSNKDPHLTNWGIIGSIISGNYVNTNILNNVDIKMAFVSPLIRTWETAACMFSGNYDKFVIGSFLREGRPDSKAQKSSMTNGSSDIPYQYEENIKRFETFKKFLVSDNNNKTFKYISNSLKKTYINKKLLTIKNVKISKVEEYKNQHLLKGNLDMFMLWFANKYPDIKGDVLVVCHGSLILKNFVRTYMNNDKYKNIKHIHNNNNFGFKVTVNFPKRKYTNDEIISDIKRPLLFKDENIKLIFNGVKKPKLNNISFINDIRLDCSLCTDKIGKCVSSQKKKNLNTHLKIIRNTSSFFENTVSDIIDITDITDITDNLNNIKNKKVNIIQNKKVNNIKNKPSIVKKVNNIKNKKVNIIQNKPSIVKKEKNKTNYFCNIF